MFERSIVRMKDWLSPTAFVCLLFLVYGVSAATLNNKTHGVSSALPSVQNATQSVEVPTDVVRSIAGSLFRVHTIDELVVLPAQTGPGYDVYATVNLGYNTFAAENVWGSDVRNQVDNFFRGVYASGQHVQDAQVYFMLGNQTVAGAGLGMDAYASLADEVDSNPGGFVRSLQASPANSAIGPADKWFYTTETSPFQ